MSEDSLEFRDRGAKLFKSLRSKSEKPPKKKKPAGSKSIFSSLMLANYEQQMQFDPAANYSSNFDIAESRKALREKCKQKIDNQVEVTTKPPEEEELEACESPELGIRLDDDPIILKVYEDVLFNISRHLGGGELDTDLDLPTINEELAIIYVKDAFGVSEIEHDTIYDKVKADEPNEECGSADWDYLAAHSWLNKILLKHELETSQTPHYYWSGKFSFLATTILNLQSDLSELSEIKLALARWIAFAEIHEQHPLNPKVFVNLFDNATKILKRDDETALVQVDFMSPAKIFLPACFGLNSNISKMITEETYGKPCWLKSKNDVMIDQFWDASKVICESFFEFIKTLHEESNLENLKADTMRSFAILVDKIKNIEQSKLKIDFENSLKQSVSFGASECLLRTFASQRIHSKDDQVRMEALVKVLKFTSRDFTTMCETYESVFNIFFHFSFAETLYEVYDDKFAELIKPIVMEISANIGDRLTESADLSKSVVKKLLQLFIQLKLFCDKGMEVTSSGESQLREFSSWFSDATDQSDEFSVFSTLGRMEAAISNDNLKPVDNKTKHSTSAEEASKLLPAYKKFWEVFEWETVQPVNLPNHIASDVCRFAEIYFDKIARRAESSEAMKHLGIFKMPLEVCVAANNINLVSRNVQNMIVQLIQNQTQEDNARIQKIVGNTLKYGKSKILHLIQMSADKMVPSIRKLLLEGADVFYPKRDIGDRLLTYIDDSLLTLREDLSDTDFGVTKEILWKAILCVFSDLISKSVELKRIPIFYTNLKTLLFALREGFELENDESTQSNDKFLEVVALLDRHGVNSSKIIHQYYRERYRMQQLISKSPFNPYGIISIRCFFIGNMLKLEVLNARNLVPFGGNRKCDSFVKLNIIPEEAFPNHQNYKTRVETDTHFPLYDELFEFDLTSEQRTMKDAIIFFNIKDKVLIRSNQCLAEAFLSFEDIPEYSQLKENQQIHLTLTRLQSDDIESLRVLQSRSQSGDKSAKDFLAKVRSKIVESPSKSKIPVTNL